MRASQCVAQGVAGLPLTGLDGSPVNVTLATMLTQALTTALARTSKAQVVSYDEMAALVAHETNRLRLGCEGCAENLKSVLGVQRVVSSNVAVAAGDYVWTVTVADVRTAVVLSSTQVRAGTAAALLARAEEVALALTGKPDTSRLEGPNAQQRLGFARAQDVEDLRRYRNNHPHLPLSSAVTQFIVEHNQESRLLALAEAGAVVTSIVLAVGACGLVGVGMLAPKGLLLVTSCGACTLTMAGQLALLAAGVLLLLDVMDFGRVEVSADGCCRDDAALQDAESRTDWTRVLGVLLLLSGPTGAALATLATLGGLFLALVVVAAARQPLQPYQGEATLQGRLLGATFIVSVLAAAGALLVLGIITPTVGIIQFMLGPRPLVNEAPRTKAQGSP